MSLPISTQMASFQLSRGPDDRIRTLGSISQGGESDLSAHRRPSFNNSPFFAPNNSNNKASNGSLNPLEVSPLKPGEPVSPRATPAATAGTASASTSSGSLSSVAMLPSTSGGPGIPMRNTSTSAEPQASTQSPLNIVPERPAKARRPRTAQGSERRASPPSAWCPPAASSGSGLGSSAGSSNGPSAAAPAVTRQPPRRVSIDRSPPPLDSTAYFITHKGHDKDVLFFGDVEPDCVSKSPRNRGVWSHAAERFAEGKLNAIFLECSFPRGHPTEFLYGHLSVEHLFDELRVLAQMVKRYRQKMRRPSNASNRSVGQQSTSTTASTTSNKTNGDGRYSHPHLAPSPLGTAAVSTQGGAHEQPTGGVGYEGGNVYDKDSELRGQLQGLGVIVIHVKPALFPTFVQDEAAAAPESPTSTTSASSSLVVAAAHGNAGDEEQEVLEAEVELPTPKQDHRTAPQKILDELKQEEELAQLGVRFVMAEKGMRIEC